VGEVGEDLQTMGKGLAERGLREGLGHELTVWSDPLLCQDLILEASSVAKVSSKREHRWMGAGPSLPLTQPLGTPFLQPASYGHGWTPSLCLDLQQKPLD
jgi:hypothetical protein